MQLLFKRAQGRSSFGKPVFRLWAQMEFEDDEQTIISHYRFENTKLIEAVQPGLLRNAALVGLASFVGVQLLLFSVHLPFTMMMLLGIAGGIGGAWLFFDQNRETIYVRDLIYGRYFNCGSVIDLARKEAWLELITAFLRQVMETARYWDGTEAVPIDALSKQEAKYVVIKGL